MQGDERLLERLVYADNAATTKIHPQVLESMMPYLTEHFGNPSSLYKIGTAAQKAVETARSEIAAILGAKSNEIYFTSGGSESDNWAIAGTMRTLKAKGKTHIVTSAFEHHAVLHTCKALTKEGFTVTYLPVYENGIVKPEDVEKAITPETGLVTIMYANNEIGTIQPIAEIGQVCREHQVLFHTDAVQAVGHVNIDVNAQNIDMLSLSGHKIHGPKGVGVLYIRNGIVLQNLIYGGAQERRKRAGTENVASIVGLSKALALAYTGLEEREARLTALRDDLIEKVFSRFTHVRLNGDPKQRLSSNVSFCFEGVEGESLLLKLDGKGISASSGSACTSGSLDPSHVLLSLGLPHETAHGSLRLSFSDETTQEDIDYIADMLPPVISYLRAISPLWERIIKKGK